MWVVEHPRHLFTAEFVGEGRSRAGSRQVRLEHSHGLGAVGLSPHQELQPSPKPEPSSLLRWVCSSPWWREVGGQGTACPKLGKGLWGPIH